MQEIPAQSFFQKKRRLQLWMTSLYSTTLLTFQGHHLLSASKALETSGAACGDSYTCLLLPEFCHSCALQELCFAIHLGEAF